MANPARIGQKMPPLSTMTIAIGQFRPMARAALNAVYGPPGIAKILPSSAIGACEFTWAAASLIDELVSDVSASISAASSLCSFAETMAAARMTQHHS
jgi:hypothetical protein